MRVAAYTRVSTIDQKKEGTSLGVQEKQIRGFCEMKDFELVGMYEDGGVSGGKPIIERPAGSELMASIGNGELDAVVITKLDRGFRNVVDCLQTVDQFDKLNVSLIILDLGGNVVDTRTAMGRFMLTVLAAAGEMERTMIRDRCNSGRAEKKAQGQRVGEIPFGYRLAEDNKTLVMVEDEQNALSLIRKFHSEGHALRVIANRLNAEGCRAKKGGSWTHGSVRSVLQRAA